MSTFEVSLVCCIVLVPQHVLQQQSSCQLAFHSQCSAGCPADSQGVAAYHNLDAEGMALHSLIMPSPAVDAYGASPTSADSTVYLQNETSTWETGSGRTSVLSGELLPEV